MRYAPVGCRSSEPIRAPLYGGFDYHAKAKDIVVAFGMIEAQEVRRYSTISTRSCR
jgi:2-keto-3-deoxy-L-rhamnonate aldolase RhmA